ncbi:MAG: 6-hydroxymethylpterin diphosphokinase MptE-like protein [Candidatus Gastranaerophilaceae bacterium]|jgi:hypothetical protein
MFEKNIDALQLKNPTLAEKIKNIPLSVAKEKIDVYKAESQDLIISYNKIPLNSIYDPIREAKTTWNKSIQKELSSKDIIIVFGLGLGYLFKRVYISTEARIVIYEPLIDVLRFVLEYIDLSEEIKNNRVFVTDNIEECTQFVGQKYLHGDYLDVLFLKSYAQVAFQELQTLSKAVLDVCQQRNFDSNTILTLTKYWVTKAIINIPYFKEALPFEFLEDKFLNKTALIVSAGPSLNDNIELIKKNRSKFVILCVNRAFKSLMAANIKPDFLIVADSFGIIPTIEGYEDELKNINLITTPRCSPEFFKLSLKSKFLYFIENEIIYELIKKYGKNDLKSYKSAGSVSIICYYIAKALGFSNIIFSGLDLAFKDDKQYSDDTKMKTDEIIQVKGAYCDLVNTKHDYALYIRQLEDIFENEKGDEKIFNAATGAFINGMEYKKLENIIENFEDTNISVDEIVQKAIEENNEQWLEIYNVLKETFLNEKTRIFNANNQIKEFIDDYKEVLDYIEKNKTVIGIEHNLKQNTIKMSDIISKLLNSVVLSSYFQVELLNYTKYNRQSDFINLNDIKSLIKNDIDILEKFDKAYNDLTLHLG